MQRSIRRSIFSLAAIGSALIAMPVEADGLALAGKNQCLACHKVDAKLVGPAYKDVAAKYKGNKQALAMLTQKVHSGGKGVWGEVMMPPQTKVSDADLKAILTWVLSLK